MRIISKFFMGFPGMLSRYNKKFLFLAIFIFLLGIWGFQAQPLWIYKVPPGLPFFKFDLTDLENNRWRCEDLKGRPIVILTGHRSLRHDILKWAKALKKVFADGGKITLLWVVNLSRYPWTSPERHASEYWEDFRAPVPLILDWHSVIGRSLKICYEIPNIIVIDAGGRLSFHQMGPCDKDSFALVSTRIQLLLGNRR